MLSLPNFNQLFTLECDASGYGVGSVLMQSGRTIASMSKALKGKTLQLSTYEKKLLAVVKDMQKQWPYMLGHSFIIKTNQQALKYLLEQKVRTEKK